MIGNFLSCHGLGRGVCEDLAERLDRAGWRVHRTSTARARLPRLGEMLSTVWRRRREYAVAQVDVYSGPAFVWAEAVCWMLRRADKPYILTLHGGNLPEFARRWPRRVRRLLRSAAMVTAPSGYLQQQMRPYCFDILEVPNPIDVARYPYRHRIVPRPRLIWLRAFHPLYDPSLAVEVLARVAAAAPDAEVTMIGPDKGHGSLQQAQRLARQLGVAAKVRFVGPVPNRDVGQHLAPADVFLNTTTVDNTPVSVLEAMACGLCVVSTDVGGMPYLIEHGRSGLLVPPRDPQAMADAVGQVLRDPELGGRLSDAARRAALEHDWSVVLPRWERLLQQVAGVPQCSL
jgi:glycosyltransferase involved in cell wall biosynthesis